MSHIAQLMNRLSHVFFSLPPRQAARTRKVSQEPQPPVLESLEGRMLLSAWATAGADRTDWSGCTVQGGDGQHVVACDDGSVYGSDSDPSPSPTPDPDPSASPGPDEPWTPDCWPTQNNNWCYIGSPYTPPGFSPEPPLGESGNGSGNFKNNGGKHSGKHFRHAPGDHPFDGVTHGSGKHKHGKGGFDDSGLAKNLRGTHGTLDDHRDNGWMLPSASPGATPTPLEQYQQQIDQIIQQQIDQFQGFPPPFLPW